MDVEDKIQALLLQIKILEESIEKMNEEIGKLFDELNIIR